MSCADSGDSEGADGFHRAGLVGALITLAMAAASLLIMPRLFPKRPDPSSFRTTHGNAVANAQFLRDTTA